MPRDDGYDDDSDGSPVLRLRLRAEEYLERAERVLEDESLGEMERQIEECRLNELSCNMLSRAAILADDPQLLKLASEQGVKWANAMRAATTKRRNDEVPKLIEDMQDRRKWAQTLLGVEEVD